MLRITCSRTAWWHLPWHIKHRKLNNPGGNSKQIIANLSSLTQQMRGKNRTAVSQVKANIWPKDEPCTAPWRSVILDSGKHSEVINSIARDPPQRRPCLLFSRDFQQEKQYIKQLGEIKAIMWYTLPFILVAENKYYTWPTPSSPFLSPYIL